MNCVFCLAFSKAKIGRWTKFHLPFLNLCEKHKKEVKQSPNLIKINEQAKKVIKPWPRLMFGKNGLGKIRIKSYFKDVEKGVTPLTWWANDKFQNPRWELRNMVGIFLKNPEVEIPTKKKKTCSCPKNDDFPILKSSLGTDCLNCYPFINILARILPLL
ncbi:MAG: hypothetical protein I3273_05070 [Candidatus Moeniiplasma glomeromycotorum]|nr:hypothetical protein [Candidatus Moeniiplasma glomeromycotorum]MCE8167914.1 hypothetical protein [Candidatus Moeniiplasma glomeromycotorum]MCE8169464.1 hypothetical protein [Candidatus Moeniiplasma glomeromycotorum]